MRNWSFQIVGDVIDYIQRAMVAAGKAVPRFVADTARAHVRFWHKADIPTRSINVRFWG